MTKPLPPPPSSGGSSSADGKATAEDLNNNIEEMMSQQAQLERAVLRLLTVVTEEGGPQWEDSPELTERALVDWLSQQEDRAEELRERLERKQRELVRAAEVEGDEWSPDKDQFNRGLSSSLPPERLQDS